MTVGIQKHLTTPYKPPTKIRKLTLNGITVTVHLTKSLISSILCSAFESPSISYWARLLESQKPTKFNFRTDAEQTYPHLDYPLNPGGYVMLEDVEATKPKKYKIDLESIQKGLEVMAKNYPKHFADLQREDFDNTTADVFIQCCCFGETLYG